MGDEPTSARSVPRFFAEHGHDIIRRARRILRSDADAEDVLQEIMLSLVRAPHLLGAIDRIRAWIFGLVRGRCVDIIRRQRRRELREERQAPTRLEDLFAGTDPAQIVEREELCRALADAVDALPEELRWVVVRNELEEATFREMSEESGVPMGTLMARKAKAMELLRAHLERQGFTG